MPEEYLIVDGKRVLKSEFYRVFVMSEAKKFAYNPQLPLFPNSVVEEARVQLRERLDSGKSIDVKVLIE